MLNVAPLSGPSFAPAAPSQCPPHPTHKVGWHVERGPTERPVSCPCSRCRTAADVPGVCRDLAGHGVDHADGVVARVRDVQDAVVVHNLLVGWGHSDVEGGGEEDSVMFKL